MTEETIAALKDKVGVLQDVLLDIAILADGHRRSTLYVDGSNVALLSVLSLAAGAIGRSDDLRRDGTLIAPSGTVAEEIDGVIVRHIPTAEGGR